MLEWPNKAPRPKSTRFGIEQLDQITSKPFLFKCKFEQLYITNFLPGASNFVGMIITPNDDTTPSGASRRDDLLNLNLENPFLLISRVYQSYIGYFAQMSSNLVEHPTSMCHSILLILMASGINFLAQTNNKHLLPFSQNHHFDIFQIGRAHV